MPAKTRPKASGTIAIPTLEKVAVQVVLRGITPLVSNRFSEDAQKSITDKIMGNACANTRGARDLDRAADQSAYKIQVGNREEYAHKSSAVLQAVIAAHRKGAPYTKKALELGFRANTEFMPIIGAATVRRDFLKNANGAPDLRCRMEYNPWKAVVEFTLYPRVLSMAWFTQALADAGELVGIGPQNMRKVFGFGRFVVESIEAL